jgi:hypothetical protein
MTGKIASFCKKHPKNREVKSYTGIHLLVKNIGKN